MNRKGADVFSIAVHVFCNIFLKICPLFGKILMICFKSSWTSFLPFSYWEKMRWEQRWEKIIFYFATVMSQPKRLSTWLSFLQHVNKYKSCFINIKPKSIHFMTGASNISYYILILREIVAIRWSSCLKLSFCWLWAAQFGDIWRWSKYIFFRSHILRLCMWQLGTQLFAWPYI